MARTVIKKQTVTFYEEDQELLAKVEAAAKANRQSFQAFVLSTLEAALNGMTIEIKQVEVQPKQEEKKETLIPKATKAALPKDF